MEGLKRKMRGNGNKGVDRSGSGYHTRRGHDLDIDTGKNGGAHTQSNHHPEYSNPFEYIKPPSTRPKDYYDIHIKWHTLNIYTSHAISRMVFRDPMVIDCRRRILSHLTTNNINIYDSGGNPIAMASTYDYKFQKYYKDFVQDAYEAYLIQGVVPVVLIEDGSGFFFPVVLKLGTYVIQTAYTAEDERQVYRVLRPIYFCARPDKLKHYEKVHDTDFSFGHSDMKDNFMNWQADSSMNLEPDPNAGMNITDIPGIKEKGWFIDPSVSVLNIFDSPPSIMGEIRSPLSGVLMQNYMAIFLADTMLQAEHKMLSPIVLVERGKETNVDAYGENRGGKVPNPGSMGEKSTNDVDKSKGAVLPIIESLGGPTWANGGIRVGNRGIGGGNKSHPLLKNQDAVGGAVIISHLNRMANDDMHGGEAGRVRYLPQGMQFSGVSKHPEVHAGTRYFEMRRQLDETICSSLEVPISLVKPQTRDGASSQSAQMKIFQRAIQTKARMMNIVLTTVLREAFSGDLGSFERIFSIKKVTEHYENIALENNRDGERYMDSRHHNRKDGGGLPPHPIPEMVSPFLVLPTPSGKEIDSIFKIKTPGNLQTHAKTGTKKRSGDTEKTGPAKDDREHPPRYFFSDEDQRNKMPLSERFSGTPISSSAAVTTLQVTDTIERLGKELHDKHGKKLSQQKGVGHDGIEKTDTSKGNTPSDHQKSGVSKSSGVTKTADDGKDDGKDEEDDDGEDESEDSDDTYGAHKSLGGNRKPKPRYITNVATGTTQRGQNSGDKIHVSHLEVRLEPIVFVSSADLMETARTGAIPFTQYQRLMAQQVGIVEPPSYGGFFGAKQNADFFRIVDGVEIADRDEIAKEERIYQREKEVQRINKKNNTDVIKLQHKLQNEYGNLHRPAVSSSMKDGLPRGKTVLPSYQTTKSKIGSKKNHMTHAPTPHPYSLGTGPSITNGVDKIPNTTTSSSSSGVSSNLSGTRKSLPVNRNTKKKSGIRTPKPKNKRSRTSSRPSSSSDSEGEDLTGDSSKRARKKRKEDVKTHHT